MNFDKESKTGKKNVQERGRGGGGGGGGQRQVKASPTKKH